ncbi:MAG: hypothetical protein KGH71_05155 [Candidatus Micrarchaeota archaeon]|nr:hypothetical protein [Candidatus Micrarchaeota archaeon]
MFENLSAGWKIGKAVRKIVYGDKGLLVYPIVAGIVSLLELIVIFLAFLIPTGASNAGYVAGLVVFYVVTTFTSTYILVAMLLGFRSYSSGKKIGFTESLSAASQYTKLIFEWAVFYSILLLIVRAIESRMKGLGGSLLGGAASLGLSVATLFAVPVIIDNKVGPIDAMRQGTEFFIKNFGKSAGGLIYTDLYNLIFILGGIITAVVGLVLLSVLGIALIMLGLILAAFGILMNFVTINVFKFMLYEYANGKKLPSGMSEELIKQGIKKEKGSS